VIEPYLAQQEENRK